MSWIDDLPSTQLEFERRFSTEAACIEYLRRQRWPDGFRCPRCGGGRAWALRSRALDQSASCDHQVSLTAGTVFHGTRKSLVLWFRVIGQFLVSKSGCNRWLLFQRLLERAFTRPPTYATLAGRPPLYPSWLPERSGYLIRADTTPVHAARQPGAGAPVPSAPGRPHEL